MLLGLLLFIEIHAFFSLRKCVTTTKCCVSFCGDEEEAPVIIDPENKSQKSSAPLKDSFEATKDSDYNKKDQEYFLSLAQVS